MKDQVTITRANIDTLLDSLLGIARLMQIWQLPLMIPITLGLLGLLLLAYTLIALDWVSERVRL